MTRSTPSPGLQAFLGDSLAVYLAAIARFVDWSTVGEDHAAPYLASGAQRQPAIFATWHSCLLSMRRALPAPADSVILVSKSRDSGISGHAARKLGFTTIEGSTAKRRADGTIQQKGGSDALRAAIHALKSGKSVILNPDGPRGPAQQLTNGLALLAAVSGAPIIAFASAVRPSLTLSSWDQMQAPLFFGKCQLVYAPPIWVARAQDLDQITETLRITLDRCLIAARKAK